MASGTHALGEWLLLWVATQASLWVLWVLWVMDREPDQSLMLVDRRQLARGSRPRGGPGGLAWPSTVLSAWVWTQTRKWSFLSHMVSCALVWLRVHCLL